MTELTPDEDHALNLALEMLDGRQPLLPAPEMAKFVIKWNATELAHFSIWIDCTTRLLPLSLAQGTV